MFAIKHILHPTDFSDGAATAFEQALHLARHFEATLHVLHVAPTFGEDPVKRAYEAATDDTSVLQTRMEEADAQMRVLTEGSPHPHVSIRRVLSRGAVAGPVILEYATAQPIDLIVMGTHGRRGVKRWLLGSVAEEVVHHAPCHVLTVRRQKEGEGEPRPIQRILVPIDFSDPAGRALQVAKAMASSYGAMLHLVYVLEPLTIPVSITRSVSIHDLVPDVIEKSRARLLAFYEGTPGPEAAVSYHIREGHPAQTIITEAEEHLADLILLAPKGMTGVERFLFGSVAERVVRTASCPVFIAKVD